MTAHPVIARPATYRGQPGFVIKSRTGGIFGTSIFTQIRESADLIAGRVRRGEDVQLDDYLAGPAVCSVCDSPVPSPALDASGRCLECQP